MNPKKARLRRFLWISLFFLAAAFLCYPYLFIHFSSQVPYAYQDDLRNILAIVNFQTHAPFSQFYHLPYFYPAPFTLTYTHPLFGISPYFKLFHLLGLNLESSTNLYLLLSLFLGAWGCYLLAAEFTDHKWPAALAASFYIIYHINFLHFVWLNFLSRFYIPFLLFFFIRFLKRKKPLDAALTILFMLLQSFACIYPGLLVWLFLVPAMLLFTLLLRLLPGKTLATVILMIVVAGLVLLAVFHPYLDRRETVDRENLNSGVTTSDLFYRSRFFFPNGGGQPPQPLLEYFPGFALMALLCLYIAALSPYKKWLAASLLFLGCLVLAAWAGHPSLQNDLLLLAIMSGAVIVVVRSWPTLDKLERFFLLCTLFFGAIFIRFSTIPRLDFFPLNEQVLKLLPVRGITGFRRLFPHGLPLLIVPAALGLDRITAGIVNRRLWLPLLGVSFIGLATYENILNIPEPLPIYRNHLTQPLWPEGRPAVYRKIPPNDDRIILEIPYFFTTDRLQFHSYYMLNWELHRNFLLNGRTANPPQAYYRELEKILGTYQWDFPSEEILRRLIQEYSVDYILVHLDMLTLNRVGENTLKKMLPAIEGISKYGCVIHRDPISILIRTREFIPISRLERRYADFHLRRRIVTVQLAEAYSGTIQYTVNGRPFPEYRPEREKITIDLRREKLERGGNTLTLIFDRPVLIDDCSLEKPSK